MTAVTLSEFLLARIAEDEEEARDCIDDGAYWLPHADGLEQADDAGFTVTTGYFTQTRRPLANVHIARHDPARVLAECEAKRRIVELHEPDHLEPDICAVCSSHAEEWPCRTLRLLALPYAGHPDYREAWKP